MTVNKGFDIDDIKRRMTGALESLQDHLSSLRTGRANPKLIESLLVDAYGARMPLAELATINAPEPQMLLAKVWDKANVKAVEKAIVSSNIGLTPTTEGQVVRLKIPDLSRERRLELVKQAGRYAEQARVAVRNVRRDALDMLKQQEQAALCSQDDCHRRSDQIQKLTDDYIDAIETKRTTKEKDIMRL